MLHSLLVIANNGERFFDASYRFVIVRPNREYLPASGFLQGIRTNKERDRLVTQTLRKQGWRVIRAWEHDLSASDPLASKLGRSFNTLQPDV